MCFYCVANIVNLRSKSTMRLVADFLIFLISTLSFNFLIKRVCSSPIDHFFSTVPAALQTASPNMQLSNALPPNVLAADTFVDPTHPRGWSLVQRMCQQQPHLRICEQTILWPHTEGQQPKFNVSDWKSGKNISTRSHPTPLHSSKNKETIDFNEILRKHIGRATSSVPGGARLQALLETMIKNTNWKMVSFRILRQLSMLLIDQILSKMLQFDWRTVGQQGLRNKNQPAEQNHTLLWSHLMANRIKRKPANN